MKGYQLTPNDKATNALATFSITGNVIPMAWYSHIVYTSGDTRIGKPYSIAIELLADIVYWYRPIEVREEASGTFLGYRKKFKADKLQRSYSSFASLYGYSKKQVRDALNFLQDETKVIDLDFRHPTINGQKLGNLLFIGLHFDRLKDICTPLSPNWEIPSLPIGQHPISQLGDTNTETTTEITTETTKEREPASPTATSAPLSRSPAVLDMSAKTDWDAIIEMTDGELEQSYLGTEKSVAEPTYVDVGDEFGDNDFAPNAQKWAQPKDALTLDAFDACSHGRKKNFADKHERKAWLEITKNSVSIETHDSKYPKEYIQVYIDWARKKNHDAKKANPSGIGITISFSNLVKMLSSEERVLKWKIENEQKRN